MQQNLTSPRMPPARPAWSVLAALGVALMAAAASWPAAAQSLFSPAIRVNDEAITHFELEQRILFMQTLRIPGKPEEFARRALIEERLKEQAIRDAGIVIEADDVTAGIEELSSRTQLSAEEFVKALGEAGIAAETLRDYVRTGIAWRDLVTQKFLAQARPTDEEIDRALGQGSSGGGVQVLLSEIIIPVSPENIEQVDALAQEISQITSLDAFAAAATQYSATDTRTDGGRLDWLPISRLPPGLQPAILALRPGEVTTPIALPSAVALFQMRGIAESAPGTPRYAAIDYAAYYIAGGRSPEALGAAQQLAARVDTCDDLFGVARGQPAEVLDRESLPPARIPQDIALELAKLDPDEVSTALTRNNGQTLVFLMLCGRTAEFDAEVSREDVANALATQRLNMLGESYLQQLLAEARIVEQ